MPVSDRDILSSQLEHFSKSHVLCIGDLILDHFVYGNVERISPEAPIPIIHIKHEQSMLGGAGNVVRNIISLGAKATFISVVGDDATGSQLTAMVGKEERVEAYLPAEKGRTSTEKTRFIAGAQQLLRADREVSHNIKTATEKKVLQLAESMIPHCDVIVLSDYAKGVLTPSLIKAIIKAARQHKKPVLIDPKRKNFGIYKGATLVTPNTSELGQASHLPVGTNKEIASACTALIEEYGFESILVTRNAEGMTLVQKNGTVSHFKSVAHEVFDVSGAGDSVLATLAVSLAGGMPLEDAAYLSNIAGGLVVSRIGTAAIYRTDLKTSLLTAELTSSTRKILPLQTALAQITLWRESGKTIGFTNGCFDLIHPGHVSLMDQAKSGCDRLIVGLNSDDSVRRLKGESRPVQNEMSRAMVLASLESVDMVVIFREDTPISLLEAIRPDLLVKGEDYTIETVVGADLVLGYGGKIMLARFSDGHSTSRIVEKIHHQN